MPPARPPPAQPTSARLTVRAGRTAKAAPPTEGVVVTSTTELATDVYASEEIQVAKCSARNSTGKQDQAHLAAA